MARSDRFDLTGRVAVITGGAGLLGREHARAITGAGGTAVLVDIDADGLSAATESIAGTIPAVADITSSDRVDQLRDDLLSRFRRIDVLINNAARDPKVQASGVVAHSRLESFSTDVWNADIAVGLTGAFLCSRSFGTVMATRGSGSIVNVASDLSVIAPDQRLYEQPSLEADAQPVKPVSYSVVKTGLVGLTRYLASYWGAAGVRVNAISPGGVEAGQPESFKRQLHTRIPLGRMAFQDEYREAIVFLSSDASSYMTGQNLVIDGGRSIW